MRRRRRLGQDCSRRLGHLPPRGKSRWSSGISGSRSVVQNPKRSTCAAGADTLLGPEMRSTGEVMGIDATFSAAYAKAAIAAGQRLPTGGKVFITMIDKYKEAIVPIAKVRAAPNPQSLSAPRTTHPARVCPVRAQGSCHRLPVFLRRRRSSFFWSAGSIQGD